VERLATPTGAGQELRRLRVDLGALGAAHHRPGQRDRLPAPGDPPARGEWHRDADLRAERHAPRGVTRTAGPMPRWRAVRDLRGAVEVLVFLGGAGPRLQ